MNPYDIVGETTYRRRKMIFVASILSVAVICLTFLLAIERSSSSGGVGINIPIFFLGVLTGMFIFLGLTRNLPYVTPIYRCRGCNGLITVDQTICQYCGYDHGKLYKK
jgi:hypothetical protein